MSDVIHRGLAGVVVDRTAISKVNPETSSLLYRGYPVQELAATQPFEAVAYLLWHGDLPTMTELADLQHYEKQHRSLGPTVKSVIDTTSATAHPMDVVRTAVSVLATCDPAAEDASPAENLRKSVELYAALPAIVSYIQRRARGEKLIAPRHDLDYPENFLWMAFGREFPPVVVDAFRVSLILYAEHSFNASTFAARVITSTLSDLYSAVIGAIGALKGPLHGGANEAVMRLFEEIGSSERVPEFLDHVIASKRKLMGFGHRVYKRGDSRVPTMQRAFHRLVEYCGRPDLLSLYDTLEREFVARKGVYPNLDYPSGPAYHLIGFDTPMFTPLFVASRVTGWTAHIMEQLTANAIIRPLSVYDGAEERHISGYIPDATEISLGQRTEEQTN